jgi:glycosyltransferase involved in cell wall biosynthesis
MANISVVICTYNPRMDYLTQVFDALKRQTLPTDHWDLLLIDNASDEPLDGRINLSWHPLARIVREEKLGLTAARLRGIRETSADVIVFVDDDNVLDADYLEKALSISEAWPILGAWGGQTLPCFEVEPPEWIKQFWGHLALRQLDRDLWSNQRNGENAPIGAGLVVRRQVAQVYSDKVALDERRQALDRKGGSLISGGDTDLALTAVDIGLGTGLFKALKLIHLISADRLSEKHLLNLQEKLSYSATLLNSIRGLEVSRPHRSLLTRVHEWGHQFRLDSRTRRFELAKRRGLEAAERSLGMNGKPD